MNKILVTGGAGFIGSHVVDNLLEKGKNVVILDIKKPLIINECVQYEKGSITNEHLVEELVSECDGIIHLGGLLGTSETIIQAKLMSRVNILGGLNILDACKTHNKRAVIISTGNYWMFNCYAITKRAMAKFALMYNEEFRTKIAIVRGMNAYGPRQKAMPIRKIMPNFVIPALKHIPLTLCGSGNQVADLIYVKDMAEILVRALFMEHGVYNSVFEAGMGYDITVKEIAELVIKLAHSNSVIQYANKRQGEELDAVIKADLRTLEPLEYSRDNMMPLEEGIKLTINWYQMRIKEKGGLNAFREDKIGRLRV